jgi:AAA15 family ATPase/GTPase
MLLSFSVSNFRSFREKQTLSMVASARHAEHPSHLCPIPKDDNRALPIAVIYGANGAGKSNLVKALTFFASLVLRGTEPKKPMGRRAFLLDKESQVQPTELEVQFAEGDHVYAYGCRLTDVDVEAEWLSLLRDGREISVFERTTQAANVVTIEAGPVLKEDSWGDHGKALALTKVGVLPNQLFLHAVGKSLQEQDQGPILSGALRWFGERLRIVAADASFGMLAQLVAQDVTFTDFAGDFLRRVATGVDRLRVDTSEVDENVVSRLGHGIGDIIQDMAVGDVASIVRPDKSELILEKGQGTKVQIRTIKSEHVTADGARVDLPFAEESDGTQRLTHLLPALHSLCQKPGLFVIDEIDRSLHPLLAKGFARVFLEQCAGKGSQLVFTTHETAFLDLELLRRDEIFFANKKLPEGTTEIYSLADYRVRKDLSIDKAYLQGRFEAVPPIEAELPDWVRQIMSELKPTKAGKEPVQG